MAPLHFFKCLADDTRLKTLLLICKYQELCVCDLQDTLDISQPKISRHLAELRKCELVYGERRGKWVYYRLHPRLPEWTKSILVGTLLNADSYLQAQIARLDSKSAITCSN